MNKRWILIGLAGLIVVAVAAFGLAGAGVFEPAGASASDGMPVPGVEGVDETLVGSEMPVPGSEGVEEMIVGSEMPVPGLGDVDEMIVSGE
jgi:hypothetical protein